MRLVSGLFLLFLPTVLHGQVVVYSFTGNVFTATSAHAQLTAGAFAGSNAPTLTNGSPVYAAGSGSYAISQSGFTGSAPGTNYFEFTLTPHAGYEVALTSFSFGSRSTGTGPLAYALRSSADGYSADLAAGTLLNDSAWHSHAPATFTLDAFSTATTFRLYAWDASAAGGTLRLDDVTLDGSVAAVPEPAVSAVILALAALGGVLAQRRRAPSPK